MRILKLLAFVGLISLAPIAANAQTNPNLTLDQVLTPGEWNNLFASKQDTLGYTPLNQAGGVMTGRLVTAPSGASTSGFNLTPGPAGASPADGDLWITSLSFFAEVNGTTYDLLNGACSICAVTNAPNTFTGSPQTVQGLTTTQPGWYAQITGDTNARVRVGLNSTDVPSIAFGPGNAVRDTFIERAAAAAVRLGSPDAASPVAQTLGVQNVVAGTSNTAGVALTIDGSIGTGTGAGGNILFKVAPAGSSGSTQNALSTALSIFGADGGLSTGAAIDEGAGTLNLAGGLYNNGTAPVGTGGYVRGASAVTTINTVACTIGSSCSISAAASNVVGSSTITGGTPTRVLFDNVGVLGEYAISGTGSVAMTNSPALVTPALGVATAASLAIGGCTIGSNVLCTTGTASLGATTIATLATITGTAHGIAEGVLALTEASMVANDQVVLRIGQATGTTNNSANFQFFFTSAGSSNNHGSLGLWGADQAISWDGNHQVGFNTGNTALDKAFTIVNDSTFFVDSGGNTFGFTIQTSGFAIASLPTCNTAAKGMHAYVTNGVAGPSFGGAVSTTGAAVQPVFCSGSGWIYAEIELTPANDNIPDYLIRNFA